MPRNNESIQLSFTSLVVTATVVVGLVLLWLSFVAVPPGHVGVITTFGRVSDATLDEGPHFVFPWQRVTPLSVRTQEKKEIGDVPTSEGLVAKLDVSLLFSLMPEKAAQVYQQIGPDYVDNYVVPVMRSTLRGATTKFKSEDLYTSGREMIERGLEQELTVELSKRGIKCERILLRSVTLPDKITTAIDMKVAAEQRRLQMEVELKQAETEAKKKLIEAEGIKKAQALIQETLTDNYIKYLWVKALEQAAANRTTMIYVPVGPNGLPIMDVAPKGSLTAQSTQQGEK